MNPHTLACLLLLTACAPKTATSPAPAASAVPTPARELRVQPAVDGVLAQSELPAAAVVLSVPRRELLGLGQRAGADPTRLALRPGSTVKPLLAWIGAEASVLRPDDKVTCTGAHSAAPEYRCFASHGELTLPAAVEVSCNVYFFELAHRVGLARIAAGFGRVGFGKPTGLSAGEASGWIADPAWAASRTGVQWDLLVGTGHGPLGVTLLQLAVAYAELAERLTRPSRDVSDQMQTEILAGLRRVVAGERGTGRAAAVAGLEIAGKTGTAEPGVYTDEQLAKSDQKDNGWFVGFTPVAHPERVVAVLVHGGGSQSAAHIAGRIFARMAEP